MIYSKGTAAVTNGSADVVGTGTRWLKRIHAGDVFQLEIGGSLYLIAEVVDDTHLTLAAFYGETTNPTADYTIVSDFSRYYSVPFPRSQDVQKASILKRSVRKIDSLLFGLNDRIFDLEYPSGAVVDIDSTPEISTVYIQPVAVGLVTADSNTVLADSDAVRADGSTGQGTQYPTLTIAAASSTPGIDHISMQALISADNGTVTADADNVTADGLYTP